MRVSEYRAMVAVRMSEAELQDHVLTIARGFGWTWFHDTDSRLNQAGLPDLILTRGPKLIFAELKSEKGRLRPAQQEWLTALGEVSAASAGAVQALVWRPGDLLAGTIAEVLR